MMLSVSQGVSELKWLFAPLERVVVEVERTTNVEPPSTTASIIVASYGYQHIDY